MQTKRIQDAGFALIGAVTIGFAAIAAERKLEFLKSAERASGSVVAVTHGTAHVQVAFTTSTGEHIEFPGNGWISHHAGDQVAVVFLSEDPRATAALDEPGALWYLPAGFASLGIVFFGAGLFGVLHRGKSDAASRKQVDV